jgi:hypothetical protein
MKAGLPILKGAFPQTAAQLTGMVVTAIVTFGTDMDVTYAVPLGIFAGALAVFFLSFAEAEAKVQTRFARVRQLSGSNS